MSAAPRRAGFALLEAIVGLSILATAGVAIVAMTAGAVRAVTGTRAADAELREADAFMHAVALWPREDLDRRLGDREQGHWRLQVTRPAPELYGVVLTDSLGGRVLLRTALYRPEAKPDE